MKAYIQKPVKSGILQRKGKDCSNIMQFLRIRLNDDVGQNIHFAGMLRHVKTSGHEVMTQLPRAVRKQYTPKVVAEEEREAERDEPAATLGINEDIVFEGHGITKFFKGRTMEGKGPQELAEIILSVVRGYGVEKDWTGRVVLLGCRTEPIVAPLSEILRKALKKDINVVGTKQDIMDSVTDTDPRLYFVYHKNDDGKKPINFTDPRDVVMSAPPLIEAEDEDSVTVTYGGIDDMGFGESSSVPAPPPEELTVTKEGDFDLISI